jgi:hypothetical protein
LFFCVRFSQFPHLNVSVGSTFDAFGADIHREKGISGATNFLEMRFPCMEKGAVSQRGIACARK